MKFKEIETKYSADEIKFEAFLKLVEPMGIKKKMTVSSFDDYFVNSDGDFIRYRYSDERGELTIKRKTSSRNNNERVEVNVPTSGDNYNTIAAFVSFLGYQHNFGIYKTCKIFWFDKVDLVYYVVYDKEFKELRRFIEIEALEDVEWESEEHAMAEVIKYEKLLEPLGITPQHRLRKSLFELFRKDLPTK